MDTYSLAFDIVNETSCKVESISGVHSVLNSLYELGYVIIPTVIKVTKP
jgi:hypothetical protein